MNITISLIFFLVANSVLLGARSFEEVPLMRNLVGTWEGPSTFKPKDGSPQIIEETNTCVLKEEGKEIELAVRAQVGGQIYPSSWRYMNLKKDGSFDAVFSDSTVKDLLYNGRISEDGLSFTLTRIDPDTKSKMEIIVRIADSLLQVKVKSLTSSSELLFEVDGVHKKVSNQAEVATP